MSKTKYKYTYIIHLQYLGFRYHGWFLQPQVKTIQQMVNKTVEFVLGNTNFKTLGSSRTDAKVSANKMAFQLFVTEELSPDLWLIEFNRNLPSDIRALSIEETSSEFNILQHAKTKEYVYLFAFGEKPHPFSASLVATFPEQLDLEKMKEGAKLFEGKHNFKQYCTKPSENTQFIREITFCEIQPNRLFTANFFPKETYALHIHSTGFMRYQVRLIMGQLVALGRGEISLDTILNSFEELNASPLKEIAPASGLILNNVHFNNN